MSKAIEINGAMYLICEWFARCTNPTLKAVKHPVLDVVPCCDRCARKAGYAVPGDMIDIEIVVETS